MKKVYLTLLSAIMAAVLLASCNQGQTPGSGNNPSNPSKITNPWGKSWFAGDGEYEFISTESGKFVRYLPDTLNTTDYFEVVSEEEKNVTVKALYSSESVRNIGKEYSFEWEITSDKLSLSSDHFIFNIEDLVTYEGTDPATFDVPAIQTVYLSNFDGDYTLKTKGWKLNIKSKICIEQDVNHSWFAHAVDVQEKDNVYDLLLCHTSNGDTGITGQEPFITSQATVWSHMVFTPAENDTTKVEWSNVWAATPAEALALPLNESDTFSFVITGITYEYEFYFGNPAQVDGYWNVDKGEKIGSYTTTSKIPLSYTWKSLYEAANLSVTIPEGKQKVGWWYLTGTLYSQKDSAVYSVKDSTSIDYKKQTFYLELEDKPDESAVYLRDGTYIFNTNYKIEIDSTNKTITYTDSSSEEGNVSIVLTPVKAKVYSYHTSTSKEYQMLYYVTDPKGNLYYCRIDYFINNGTATYIKAHQIPYVEIDEEEDFRESIGSYNFSGKIKSYFVQ